MKTQLVHDTATALTSYGYIVYLSKNKQHGFYTDGRRVVSFGGQWNFSLDFSGNYQSQHCGTGWQIAREQGVPTKKEAGRWISAEPPIWATDGEKVRITTPEQHLKTYGPSSGYEKFMLNADQTS